jgi:nucleoside 2-deoxyribosyltransferase
MADRPRVYLAGPDVFLAEAPVLAERKKALCAAYGLEGVFPLDKTLDLAGLSPRDRGLAIARANERLMDGCDLAIAQMTPFRGPGMDGGTAYEMGYMRAQGKPVLGYSNVAATYAERVRLFHADRLRPRHGQPETFEDPDGLEVEAFGMLENLMMHGAIVASGGEMETGDAAEDRRYTALDAFERCLAQAARLLGVARPARP